jgi:hypothetical protein
VLAGFAADNEGATGQMLSGMLEFLELLAVPSGYLLVEVSHGVAFDQYRNGCRLPWIGRYHGRQVPIEPVTPGRGVLPAASAVALRRSSLMRMFSERHLVWLRLAAEILMDGDKGKEPRG